MTHRHFDMTWAAHVTQFWPMLDPVLTHLWPGLTQIARTDSLWHWNPTFLLYSPSSTWCIIHFTHIVQLHINFINFLVLCYTLKTHKKHQTTLGRVEHGTRIYIESHIKMLIISEFGLVDSYAQPDFLHMFYIDTLHITLILSVLHWYSPFYIDTLHFTLILSVLHWYSPFHIDTHWLGKD